MKSLSLSVVLLSSALRDAFALSNQASPTIKIRVCEGSSCESKCRGTFTPKSSFQERIASSTTNDESSSSIIIEEAFCMNQCKRGPNVRLIKDDQVLTFEDESGSIMNDTELKRKTFQSVTNDEKIDRIWGVVEEIQKGDACEIEIVEGGHVDKLSDLLPQRQ